MHYIRVRPVPSLEDQSEIVISPETAEPGTRDILLRVKPRLRRLAVKSAGLRVTASVEIPDNKNRLDLVNSTATQNIPANRTSAGDLVFTYKRKNNTDYDPLNFSVTLEYSLADCTDTYQTPCPVFDSEDVEIEDQVPDKEGKRITKTMNIQTLNFNICEDPRSCQCDVSAVVKPSEQIIAGAAETVRLGSLALSNTGSEASYNTQLNVTIHSGARLSFPRTEDGSCRKDIQNGTFSRSCNIFVDKSLEVPIEVVPLTPIKPGVNVITVSVTVKDHCMGRNNTKYNQTVNIPVVHRWTLKPQLTAGKDSPVSWSYDSPERTSSKSLDYTITNLGPSMSTETHLYVYLPDHRLIRNMEVQFDGETCSGGNKRYLQTPPVVSSSSAEDEMQISCTTRGNCLLYKCPVNQTERSNSKPLRVSYDFRLKEAESEGVTKFSVLTSVCVQQAVQTKDCSEAGEILNTASQFRYYPTLLHLIYSNWQILVAVCDAILVSIIAHLLARKFNLFQRARIVRNQGEGEEETNLANVPRPYVMTLSGL